MVTRSRQALISAKNAALLSKVKLISINIRSLKCRISTVSKGMTTSSTATVSRGMATSSTATVSKGMLTGSTATISRGMGYASPLQRDVSSAEFNQTMDNPRYCNMTEAVKLFFKNYANFSGRSTRSEYWFANLFSGIITFALIFFAAVTCFILNDSLSLSSYFMQMAIVAVVIVAICALLVPSIALFVRRLHDVGASGLTVFLIVFGFIGVVALFVMTVLPSAKANKYGPAPNPIPPQPRDPNHIEML